MIDQSPAFSALWYPFATGALAWREPALFMRARPGRTPEGVRPPQIDCLQSFKPFADDLQRAGWPLLEHVVKTYPLVLVLPPPQRDETRSLFAQALRHAGDDGIVVASMENNSGARSGEKDLSQLAPGLQSTSKNKCRVFWVTKKEINETLLQEWLELDAPRRIEATGFISRPGVFAWDRIDAASQLLAGYLPKDLTGHGADLGAGMGYLTHFVLSRCENIHAMDIYEAETRALACAKANLAHFEARTALNYHWHDVARGVQGFYDFVISNPPFHQGGVEVQAVGQAFIEAAAQALKPGGRFYMVANRHLPYEAVLQNHFSKFDVIAVQDGFKVFSATK